MARTGAVWHARNDFGVIRATVGLEYIRYRAVAPRDVRPSLRCVLLAWGPDMELTRKPRLPGALASRAGRPDPDGYAARGGLRIAHVIAPGIVGGANTVVRLLSASQQALGHRVIVLTVVGPSEVGHPFLDELSSAGIAAIPVAVPTRGYAAERRRVRAILEEFTPSVVHTHGYRADVVDAPVARALGVPVVSTVHGFTGGGWKSQCYQWLQRRAFRHCDAVVVVSRPLVEEIAASGVGRDRIHCVPNAFKPAAGALRRDEARKALGLPERGHVVGWVGRLSREKGADVFLDAFAQMLSFVDATAVVIGDGAEREALERQAQRSGIGDRVRFRGALPQAERYFAAFDLFVLSSRTEGTPMVIFEGMAAAVPVVATRVGGVPDLLGDSPDRLVPSEDASALAAAMAKCARDPQAAAEQAIAARRRVETEHGVDQWCARYDRIYRGLISLRPTR